MPSNIFHSKPFQSVAQCDVEHTNFATDEGEKKLLLLTQKVIDHLTTSELGKGEDELLSQFIGKIEQIDKRLSESGRGADLKVYTHALKVLKGLRTGLDPSHQEIARDEFILFLSVIEERELDDPLNRAVQLIDFLDQQLLAALENTQNRQELKALEPLVDDCISLIDRLKKESILGPAAKTLEKHRVGLVDLWNVRYLQMQPLYQRLLTYQKGEFGDISNPPAKKEKLQELIDDFKKNIDHPALTRKEKIAIFRAIAIITDEFAEHGIKAKFSAEEAFCSFLKKDLLAAIEDAKSLEDLKALRPALRACVEVSNLFNHKQVKSEIDALSQAYLAKQASFVSEKKSAVEKKPVKELQTSRQDRMTIAKLSKDIIDLKPTIGDANAYQFSAMHGQHIDEAKSKSAALGMLAAGMRLHKSNKRYSDSPQEILRLGQDLLRDHSGVCDHMAAAVIAKIVEHIRKGGEWNADVELVGNGAHAFIVINRPHGEINDLDNWKGAIVVDTWLGAIGVHPNYQRRIPSPQNGVISDPQQVQMFATAFGAQSGRMSVTKRFSAEELRALVKK